MDRDTELAMIAAFLDVKLCPPAFVAPTPQGQPLSAKDIAAHLQHIEARQAARKRRWNGACPWPQ
jgi:hypothetical protein